MLSVSVWRYFHFWKKILQAEQKHFASCGRCFARFILSFVNNETQWRHDGCLSHSTQRENTFFYASSKSLYK